MLSLDFENFEKLKKKKKHEHRSAAKKLFFINSIPIFEKWLENCFFENSKFVKKNSENSPSSRSNTHRRSRRPRAEAPTTGRGARARPRKAQKATAAQPPRSRQPAKSAPIDGRVGRSGPLRMRAAPKAIARPRELVSSGDDTSTRSSSFIAMLRLRINLPRGTPVCERGAPLVFRSGSRVPRESHCARVSAAGWDFFEQFSFSSEWLRVTDVGCFALEICRVALTGDCQNSCPIGDFFHSSAIMPIWTMKKGYWKGCTNGTKISSQFMVIYYKHLSYISLLERKIILYSNCNPQKYLNVRNT